jgi:hypothetical protein
MLTALGQILGVSPSFITHPLIYFDSYALSEFAATHVRYSVDMK